MKAVVWVGSSKEDTSAFPDDAKDDAGHQLYQVQQGLDPDNWKPMSSVGIGVREIRIQTGDTIYRVFYVTNLGEVVYVLHAFGKKTEKTSKQDIRIGEKRLKALKEQLKKEKKRDAKKAKTARV